MAVTPQQFFTKNMKWFALAFLFLFLFKSIQSCNRNVGIRLSEKEYKHTIDSLTKKVDILYDTIFEYKSEIKTLNVLLNEKIKQLDGNQTNLQRALERNTTIINNIEKIDTTKNK